MQSGILRHRVTFQEPIETLNEVGETITTWRDYKTVWAEVKPIRGDEFWASRQVNAEVTHRVSVRYMECLLDTKMQIRFKGRYFSIEPPINPDEKNISLTMLCKEIV